MSVIQIETPSPERALPVLHDAIERQLRLLSQSVGRTEARVRELTAKLHVDPEALLRGEVRHPEGDDLALLELEGEIEILGELREQLDSLRRTRICR